VKIEGSIIAAGLRAGKRKLKMWKDEYINTNSLVIERTKKHVSNNWTELNIWNL
jgi:hypothetical protein